MFVYISVESIVAPVALRTSCALEDIQDGRKRAEAICRAFGWSGLPWEDPAERNGSVLTRWPRAAYAALVAVAKANAGGREGQAAPPRFRHFLACLEDTIYFIPASFADPLRLPDPELSGHLVVGSAGALLQEMTELEGIVRLSMEEHGAAAEAGVPYTEGDKLSTQMAASGCTWGDMHGLCVSLKSAAEESIALKLPIRIVG